MTDYMTVDDRRTKAKAIGFSVSWVLFGVVLVVLTPDAGGIVWALGLAMVMCIYIVPTFCAFYLGHPNKWMILLVNMFGGATVFLWFACLFWALSDYVVGGTTTANVGPPSLDNASQPNEVNQLERLSDLWIAGHLTDEEFQAAKQRLLRA